MSVSPAERSTNARVAAHASWAKTTNRSSRTAPAHAGLEARIAREYGIPADLPPAEYAVRIASAKKAYFGALARRSVRSRRAAREGAAA